MALAWPVTRHNDNEVAEIKREPPEVNYRKWHCILFRGPGSSDLLRIIFHQVTCQPFHRIVRTDLDKLGHSYS